MKRIGCLRDNIRIQELTSERDAYGAVTQEWRDICSVRASVSFNRGEKTVENYEIITSADAEVIIREYGGINE